MKRRSAEIFQRLLNVPHRGLDLQRLMEDYQITEKTLRGDIQEIIDFTGGTSVSANSHTLCLQKGSGLQTLRKRLEVMDLYDYKLSSAERKYYIVWMVFCLTQSVSMKKHGWIRQRISTGNPVPR